MNFSKFVDESDGLVYYTIPKGTRLYRGDTDAYHDYLEQGQVTFSPNRSGFFGVQAEGVESYGIIFEFITDKEYVLLALDDDNVMSFLFDNANDKKIKRILRENYGYGGGTRNSVSGPDNYFSNYLCSLGYNGYAITQTKTDFGGTFHEEIMLCNAEHILFSKIVTIDEREIMELLNLKAHRKASLLPRKSRKNRHDDDNDGDLYQYDKGLFSKSLFDSPEKNLFDSPGDTMKFSSGVEKSLFGSPENTMKFSSGKSLFGDDEYNGGKLRRKTRKSRKTRKPRKPKKPRKPRKSRKN